MHPHCCTYVQRLLTLLPVHQVPYPSPSSSSHNPSHPLHYKSKHRSRSYQKRISSPSPLLGTNPNPHPLIGHCSPTSPANHLYPSERGVTFQPLTPHCAFSCADHAWHGELLHLSLVTGQGKICSLKVQEEDAVSTRRIPL